MIVIIIIASSLSSSTFHHHRFHHHRFTIIVFIIIVFFVIIMILVADGENVPGTRVASNWLHDYGRMIVRNFNMMAKAKQNQTRPLERRGSSDDENKTVCQMGLEHELWCVHTQPTSVLHSPWSLFSSSRYHHHHHHNHHRNHKA